MTVAQLIELLQQCDLDKPCMIQLVYVADGSLEEIEGIEERANYVILDIG